MRRFGVVVAAAWRSLLGAAPGATAAPYTADKAVKINVMGEWAHPDDDTSIIGPCGVWHQRYDVQCGIIMVTRGEGGGNATGTEIGPALGLRRENEDRVAHYRSGTIDIFNVDSVDFFYNTSAPLTQFFWGTETLRRITRIIRMTQPDIYIGFTPSLNASHGNHQHGRPLHLGGRQGRGRPEHVPGAADGPERRQHVAGQEDLLRRLAPPAPAAPRPPPTAPPASSPPRPTWTRSRACGPATTRRTSGRPATSRASPRARRRSGRRSRCEGAAAYPTQSRVMFNGAAGPGLLALRHDGLLRAVPAQRERRRHANPRPGKDDAILYGATKPDPGGLPLGTLEYLSFSRFFNTPGTPFQATLNLKAGGGALARRHRRADAARRAGPRTRRPSRSARSPTAPRTRSRSRSRRPRTRRSTRCTRSPRATRRAPTTGYTDDTVRLVSPAEGRFQRFGKWLEYDNWLENTAPAALPRSAARPRWPRSSMGETIDFPVNVHNWSDVAQSGTVSLTLPANFTADRRRRSRTGRSRRARDATVTFSVTNTDTTHPGRRSRRTSPSRRRTPRAGPARRRSACRSCPRRRSRRRRRRRRWTASTRAGEYAGSLIDIGRIWEGGGNCPAAGFGTDCGTVAARVGGPTSHVRPRGVA